MIYRDLFAIKYINTCHSEIIFHQIPCEHNMIWKVDIIYILMYSRFKVVLVLDSAFLSLKISHWLILNNEGACIYRVIHLLSDNEGSYRESLDNYIRTHSIQILAVTDNFHWNILLPWSFDVWICLSFRNAPWLRIPWNSHFNIGL